jgi:3',5'-nucleoside bisphosphate phosphatase
MARPFVSPIVADLHLHTTASDGSLSPTELVRAAHAARLTVISVTDHDTTGGIAEAAQAAAGVGIELIAGIEITAVAEGRDLHMLGYFIDPSSPGLGEFLQRQRADRVRRIRAMADRLAALGVPIDSAQIFAAADRGQSVGRPQVASALLAAGHVQTRDEAFRRFLEFGGPAYVPRDGASPEDVIAVIHQSNGLASVAHPGVSHRDHVLPRLAGSGLDAIEVRHPDHDPETERRYRQLAGELGLRVTGGSDFHGDTGHRSATLGTVTLPAADYEALAAVRPRP